MPYSGENRPWGGESTATPEEIALQAANPSMLQAVSGVNSWSVSDAADELKGNRQLAEALLDETEPGWRSRPKTEQKKTIENEMRNIQRRIRYEKGLGGEVRNPKKASPKMQRALNKVARKAAHGGKSSEVVINGDTSVNGYRRNRNMGVKLNAERTERFLNALNERNYEAAWSELAKAANVGELHGLDDAKINFDLK